MEYTILREGHRYSLLLVESHWCKSSVNVVVGSFYKENALALARAYCVYCTLHSKHHEPSPTCLPSFSPGSASSSAISGMMWSMAVASSTPPPTHSSRDSTTLCSRPLEPRTLLRHNFGAELCNFVTRWSPERDGGQAYQERHDSKDEDDENLGIEHVHGGCWWIADWEMSWCYV